MGGALCGVLFVPGDRGKDELLLCCPWKRLFLRRKCGTESQLSTKTKREKKRAHMACQAWM